MGNTDMSWGGGGLRSREGGGGGSSGWFQGHDKQGDAELDQATLMEEGNSEKINQLSDQVARMKQMSNLIGDELKKQDGLIDDVEADISGAREKLKNIMKHMNRLIQQSKSWHMIIFCLFCCCFFW